jgi:hypothetical protein
MRDLYPPSATLKNGQTLVRGKIFRNKKWNRKFLSNLLSCSGFSAISALNKVDHLRSPSQHSNGV